MTAEFKIGQTITVDRYNAIGDEDECTVLAYGHMPVSERLTYVVNINGCEIEVTGKSVMESTDYSPAPEEQRSQKLYREPR